MEDLGLKLLIVSANASGWSQQKVGDWDIPGSDFCRLVQKTGEGAQHCQLCHVMMAIAACSDGPIEQRCHSGASVLVVPAEDQTAGAVAVMSVCLNSGEDAWPEARAYGEKLGVDMVAYRKAFSGLPRMGVKERRIALRLMRVIGSAVQEVKRNAALQTQLKALQKGSRTSLVVEDLIRNNRWVKSAECNKRAEGMPMLIHVVCELIRQRPDLPLSVKELAVAARMTPNHFTSLFHRHTGQIFTEYLSNVRLKLAKEHLSDLTLNINEISRLVGYDDPSYFTRWFRLRTGLSPREWRETPLSSKKQAN